MNKKQSTAILGGGISVAVVAVYILVAYNGMSPYEPYATGFEHNFGSGVNHTFNEIWCLENKGFWEPVGTDCHFKTEENLIHANNVFAELHKTKVTGKTAENVCAILERICPEDPVFDAGFNPDRKETDFSLVKGQIEYNFIIKGTEIQYRTSDEMDKWIIFEDVKD